jgi:ADP-ribose pyrophosphatase YjhB (NUDIX family)
MKTEREITEFIENGHKVYLHNIAIDCAIFGYHDQQLKILLAKWRGLDGYSMPGGFVGRLEPLSIAADRILKEKTSLDNVFLRQYYTFGDSEYRSQNNKFPQLPKDSWLRDRRLSIGYYALVDYSRVTVEEDILTEKYVWEDVDKIPTLLFDHNEMLEKALHHMRINLYHQPIGYTLLEKKFTLPEIQSLYETILDKPLDRRNFPKKLMSLGLIKDTGEVRSIGQHRSPKLYTFDKKKYDQCIKEGIVLAF